MSFITIRGAKKPPSASPWSLIWKTVSDHERVYRSVAARTTSDEGIRTLRQFFRIWDPVYTDAIIIDDDMAHRRHVSDDRIRRLVKALFVAREAAMRIGLGLSDRGVFYPKIDDATMRVIRAYRATTPPLAVAGEAMSRVPENFRATLAARVTEDNILHVEGCYGGRCYSTTIDLKPIEAQIKEMIRRYHTHVLHGDMREETIAGLGDWYRSAKRTSKRIANAKAAKKLWAKVKQHHGMIEEGLSALGPFGTAAKVGIRTGLTVRKMLDKAKRGDPQAIHDVRSVAMLAREGDPSAEQVMRMMKALNEMGKIKDEKAGTSVAGWFYNLGMAN